MIKINLVREGRAVRGAGAATGMPCGRGVPSNVNNILVVAGLLLGALIAGGWWYMRSARWPSARRRWRRSRPKPQRLEQIIKEVADYQKQKDNLQKRIDLINQLKQNQRGPGRS